MRKFFPIILFVIVLVSYGQLLGMHVWQDDNALFFKLAYIEEKAGYLGAGPIGIGAYKWIQTPYIPIYTIFEFNTVAYFSLAIICYFLTALVIYKLTQKMFGEIEARLASFFYASGYIASDGFIRLFNTIITSLSIILISFLTFFYWKFFKEGKIQWYLFALLFYLLAVEFGLGRTHYLISVVFAFEIFFLAFRKPILKSLAGSLMRLVPVSFIFYKYYVINADSRSGNIGKFLISLVNGEYYKLYGYLSSLGNVFIPDWFTQTLTRVNQNYIWIIASIIFFLTSYIIFKRSKKRKLILITLTLSYLIWVLVSKSIFSVAGLSIGATQLFVAFAGGAILILLFASIFVFDKKLKGMYLLFLSWFLINIAAYSAYNPTVSYETINRYLAHSFFALCFLLAIIYKNVSSDKKLSKIVIFLIILWGSVNILSSVIYQNKVLRERSNPAKRFYEQLKNYVPEVKKGDVFYFDVSENAQGYFNDAFSVASMPEPTAIAWRYGIDRYDIRLFTDYSSLEKLLANPKPVITDIQNKEIPVNRVHTFFYSKDGLVDTSKDFAAKSAGFTKLADFQVNSYGKTSEIVFNKPLNSVKPNKIIINMSSILKPFSTEYYKPKFIISSKTKESAFNYKKDKEAIVNGAKLSVSNYWQKDVGENLIDNKLTTFWRADRIAWKKPGDGGGAIISLDFGFLKVIDRFVFINAYENSSPTDYILETSINGKDWVKVSEYKSIYRISPSILQVVNFSPQKARYIRMQIKNTLDGDSPMISEIWAVPVGYRDIDLNDIHKYIENPFAYVGSEEEFNEILKNTSNIGRINIHWQSNKAEKPISKEGMHIEAIYDGSPREYSFTLPAGGTKIDKIILDQSAFGEIKINSVFASN